MPASSFSLTSSFASLPGRASAAIGSLFSDVSRPSSPTLWMSAFGKHSWSAVAGLADAPGSPPTISAKMRCSRPSRLKVRISSLTHFDAAAFGEQMTIWNADCCSARVSVSPRLVAVASSSRSRNTGAKRSGTGPYSVSRPTRCFGTR